MERHQKFAESLWRTRQSVKPCIFFISFYPCNMFFKLYIWFVPACSCARVSIMQRAEEKVLGLVLAIRLWGHRSSCFCSCPTYCRPIGESYFQPTLLFISTCHLTTRVLGLQMCAFTSGCLCRSQKLNSGCQNCTTSVFAYRAISWSFFFKILFCVCYILALEGY